MNGNCKTVISTSAKLMCSANPLHCVPRENHGAVLSQAEEHTATAAATCCGLFSKGAPLHLCCSLMLILRARPDLIPMLMLQHRQTVAWMHRECYGTIPPSVWHLV